MKNGAVSIVRRLVKAGFTAVWAGGCVRDQLMGKVPKDYDIATNARPEQILTLFPKSNLAGKAFGVIRTTVQGHVYEMATFRADHDYQDGRHPRSISFTDIKTDAQRRDFTINALYYDPIRDQVIDYVGGIKDLDRGLVRCVGRPDARFREDYLRLMRAVRFSCTLSFRLAPATRAAILRNAHSLREMAGERVRDELTRILLETQPSGDALRTLHRLGLLNAILPEILTLDRKASPNAHRSRKKSRLDRIIRMLNMAPVHQETLAYAILLHNLPVHQAQRKSPIAAASKISPTETILRRLRFPRRQILDIKNILETQSLLRQAHTMTRPELRRLTGLPVFSLSLELYRRSCLAGCGIPKSLDFLLGLSPENSAQFKLPAPLVTGRDILRCGVPEGPAVGQWRQMAYDRQLEDERRTKKAILSWISGKIGESLRQS